MKKKMIMGFDDDMVKLVHNIASSCDARLKAVGTLVKDTHSTLGNFHRERMQMTEEQKSELASFRKALADEAKKLLDGFSKEHRQMATALKEDIGKFHGQMYKETHGMLKEFRSNFEKMSQELHAMLSRFYKGEIKKPVHDMLSKFHSEMKALADEFQKAHEAWMSFSRSKAEKTHPKSAGGVLLKPKVAAAKRSKAKKGKRGSTK